MRQKVEDKLGGEDGSEKYIQLGSEIKRGMNLS
jgi:hypothetical protein